MSTEPITLLIAALCGVICALTGIPAAVLKGSVVSVSPSAGIPLSTPFAKTFAPISSSQASAKLVQSVASGSAFAASAFRTASLISSAPAHTIRTG